MARQVVLQYFLCALLFGSVVGVSLDGGPASTEDEDKWDYFSHGDDGAKTQSGKLNMITTSPEKIEGFYYSKDGGGIHFMSEIYATKAFLAIRTLQGDALITSLQYPHGVLLTIMGRQFLILNSSTIERRELTAFVVPQEYSEHVYEKLASNRVSRKVLRHNNFYKANTTRQNAYEELLSQAEIDMIIDAAEMLGNSGVLRTGNPSAVSFYMLALRFSKFRPQYFETELVPKRTKRGGPNCWWGKTHCSNNGECCYKCPETSDCLGLCGPGCRCWPWVCLDCCWNQLCYDHDQCCSNAPYSWGCLVVLQGLIHVPLNWISSGLACDVGYWCYSDAQFVDPTTVDSIRDIFQG